MKDRDLPWWLEVVSKLRGVVALEVEAWEAAVAAATAAAVLCEGIKTLGLLAPAEEEPEDPPSPLAVATPSITTNICRSRRRAAGTHVLFTCVEQWFPRPLQQVLHLRYSHSFFALFPQSLQTAIEPSPASPFACSSEPLFPPPPINESPFPNPKSWVLFRFSKLRLRSLTSSAVWLGGCGGGRHGVAAKSGKMPTLTPRAAEEGRGRDGWWSEERIWVCWWREEGVGAINRTSLRPSIALLIDKLWKEDDGFKLKEGGSDLG